MILATDLRKGATFELGGEIYQVLEYEFYKPGKGNAIVKTKLRNLRTRATIERNFISDEKVQEIRLEYHIVQYLYTDGGLYYFMDTETYEQPALSAEALGDAVNYLKEGLVLGLSMYEGEPIEVELPTTVDLEVTKTPPSFKGDTATGGGKPATLETGLVVQVPFFIEVGDVVRVDTRTGEYVTRV